MKGGLAVADKDRSANLDGKQLDPCKAYCLWALYRAREVEQFGFHVRLVHDCRVVFSEIGQGRAQRNIVSRLIRFGDMVNERGE